ncbi:TetR/AcrR family transcriptional regulator [Nocardia sp. NPDC101769]|uniref:TetR/AcrR family transcriptional regulator n=1 Tax=Nocardia sp. NPDC101769 TaxID=3364333 RepID=UPI00382DA3D0
MSVETGRRELNKQATRRAIQQAADRLFAERGFATTTVREIADAAEVSERTFFRYFSGKEELLTEQVIDQMTPIGASLLARPANEAPLTAVCAAILALLGSARAEDQAAVQLFQERKPADALPRSGVSLLIQVEEAISVALAQRLRRYDPASVDIEFRAGMYARISVAVLRSVLLRDLQLRTEGVTTPDPAAAVAAAFAAVPGGWGDTATG